MRQSAHRDRILCTKHIASNGSALICIVYSLPNNGVEILLALLTAIIIFGAIAISATFGFGSALISMPLLTALLGLQTATPLFGLVGSTSTLCILLLSWQRVVLGSAWRLMLGTVVGIPLGILLIRLVPESIVVGGLGIFLILFAVYRILNAPLPQLQKASWGYGFGFIAGILGGAYNTNGPPIVVYGAMKRWPPHTFRATLQGYFLPTGLVILMSHGLAGLWTQDVVTLYLWSLPGIFAGVGIGHYLHQRISPERFNGFLSALLIGLGVMLLQGLLK